MDKHPKIKARIKCQVYGNPRTYRYIAWGTWHHVPLAVCLGNTREQAAERLGKEIIKTLRFIDNEGENATLGAIARKTAVSRMSNSLPRLLAIILASLLVGVLLGRLA